MHALSDPEPDPASHTGAVAPGAPRHLLRSLMTRAALTGGITELALVGAHVLMYPLGARADRLRPDPRCRPGEQPPAVRALFAADPLAARVPVVLVHGLIDNHSVFAVMRRRARRRPAPAAHLRADRVRAGARRGAQPRRPARPLPRAAPGR
jgi:hypothetical protein